MRQDISKTVSKTAAILLLKVKGRQKPKKERFSLSLRKERNKSKKV